MYIRHKRGNFVYDVYGVSREVQQMPARNWTEVITWFLVWDTKWMWVNADDYELYKEE